jgi:glycine/serine hydroxymethyltransferase
MADQHEATDFAVRLDAILCGHQEFRRHVIPLCAAETPVSDYVRSFLSDPIHEKYAMGGPLRPQPRNFVGAEHVLDLHRLTIDLCLESFGASYADPRPLSGTSAVTNLLMTLSEPGQRILLQSPASGGHPSMTPICRRLGLEIVDLPYDYERFQIDVAACCEVGDVDFVLFAPSDILYAPDFESLHFTDSTTVIYDATQTLGLIASGHLPCPLNTLPRLVISAGTHKTLPGPSSGLLMTNNEEIAARLDTELSPKFVRHAHPHHMAALCATLIEHQAIGHRYSERIQEHASVLAGALEGKGLQVLQDGDRRTETHQLFLQVSESRLDAVYERAGAVGITLNPKRKPLFRDSGLRLGVQEIARYQWSASDLERLADVLAMVVTEDVSVESLRPEVHALARNNVFADDMHLTGTRLS